MVIGLYIIFPQEREPCQCHVNLSSADHKLIIKELRERQGISLTCEGVKAPGAETGGAGTETDTTSETGAAGVDGVWGVLGALTVEVAGAVTARLVTDPPLVLAFFAGGGNSSSCTTYFIPNVKPEKIAQSTLEQPDYSRLRNSVD